MLLSVGTGEDSLHQELQQDRPSLSLCPTTPPAKKKSYSQDEEEGEEEEREEPADEDGGVPTDKNPMIKVVKDKGKGKRNGKEPSKTSKTLPKTSKGKGQAKKNKFIL